MTLGLRWQDLSERNLATTLESVLLGRVANKDWVMGAILVWALSQSPSHKASLAV